MYFLFFLKWLNLSHSFLNIPNTESISEQRGPPGPAGNSVLQRPSEEDSTRKRTPDGTVFLFQCFIAIYSFFSPPNPQRNTSKHQLRGQRRTSNLDTGRMALLPVSVISLETIPQQQMAQNHEVYLMITQSVSEMTSDMSNSEKQL